jgi:hypothetical protein
MSLVNLRNITEIEFGVRLKYEDDFQNFLVPTADPLKQHFHQMLANTLASCPDDAANIEFYDPAQTYSGEVCLQLSLDSPLMATTQIFFAMENIPLDATKIEENENIFAYFCIFRHRDGTKTIGIRKATQFKGVTNQKLITLCDDTLEFVRGQLFKLDYDFDYIITSEKIFIHRVSGFESITRLNDVILERAQQNTVSLGQRLPWIDIEQLGEYTRTHMRAARLIASIVSRENLESISIELLRNECGNDGVILEEINGKISPAEKSEFGFLNVLDRRRYHMMLIPDIDEIYEAPTRHGIE